MTVAICEVGPRDGLQNEIRILTPQDRAEFVRRLATLGFAKIEVASFVSPYRVPQMDAAERVVSELETQQGCPYVGLVLNEKGYNRLRSTQLRDVRVVVGATDVFSRRNQNMSKLEGLSQAIRILRKARDDGIRTSAIVAVAFGCPFEGDVDQGAVIDLARELSDNGCEELVFADTIGVATPSQVRVIARGAATLGKPIGLHLHDTRRTGLVNAYIALEEGIRRFDASVRGLGGCPFAPGAGGNIASEDLVYLLEHEGVSTNVDLDQLIRVGEWVEGLVGRSLIGGVSTAGNWPPVSRAKRS